MFWVGAQKLKCQGGFSLVEVVMVMLLLSITAASFASSFNFAPTHLKHAEEKIMADVRYAKNLAMTRGGYYGLFFEPSKNRYTVFEQTPNTPVRDPMDLSRNFVVDFDTDGACKGVDLASASFQNHAVLLFDAQGIPRDIMGIEMNSDGQIIIANDSGSRTMTVSSGTGKIQSQ